MPYLGPDLPAGTRQFAWRTDSIRISPNRSNRYAVLVACRSEFVSIQRYDA
jgi:hypothetical protein